MLLKWPNTPYNLFRTNYLLGKGGYVFGSVGLSVCGQDYSKSYERIEVKFYGEVLGSTMKNWLNFGNDLNILRWVNEQKTPW